MSNGQQPNEEYRKVLPFVLKWEGGFVDDPDDHGGRTNKGITQRVYDAWRDSRGEDRRDVLSITDSEVEAIYFERYWLKASCDALRERLDLAQLDTAVNMGTNRAARILQEAAGCAVDGKIGPVTLKAAAECDLASALVGYCDIREGLYRTFASRPGQSKFLKGWLNRLNDLRRNLGLAVPTTRGETPTFTAEPTARIPDLGPDEPLENWR